MQALALPPCLQLTALPDSIGGCTSLLRLGLKGNRLVTLPTSVGKLASLVELYLTGRGSCPAAACTHPCCCRNLLHVAVWEQRVRGQRP